MKSRPLSVVDHLELHVSLRHIEPAIWRRVRVPAALSLGVLHDVLQTLFGWEDSHLHQFEVGHLRFAAIYEEDEMLSIDEEGAPLGAVAQVGGELVYLYDFGDDWFHDIKVERVAEPALAAAAASAPRPGKKVGKSVPSSPLLCLDGKRASPPEDSGGPHRYPEMLKAIANPKHPQHDELTDWIDEDFDPEHFDIVATNKALATLAKQLRL